MWPHLLVCRSDITETIVQNNLLDYFIWHNKKHICQNQVVPSENESIPLSAFCPGPQTGPISDLSFEDHTNSHVGFHLHLFFTDIYCH